MKLSHYVYVVLFFYYISYKITQTTDIIAVIGYLLKPYLEGYCVDITWTRSTWAVQGSPACKFKNLEWTI